MHVSDVRQLAHGVVQDESVQVDTVPPEEVEPDEQAVHEEVLAVK